VLHLTRLPAPLVPVRRVSAPVSGVIWAAARRAG